MSRVRQPAVADMFYPGDPGQLRGMVRDYLQAPDAGGTVSDEDAPKGLIVPHAGYMYSGPVAGTAYAQLRFHGEQIRRVVLLGPAHRVPLRGLALPEAVEFASPLGTIEVDREATVELLALPQVRVDGTAHGLEHSLEVQLPFLQEVLSGGFSLVPLVGGEAAPEEVAEVLELLWGGEETLIVISSDLSHYRDYEVACRIDRETSRAIEELEFDRLELDRACGCIPIQGLLLTARRRGLRVVNVDLRNSGDTSGTRDKVVGYGSYIVF